MPTPACKGYNLENCVLAFLKDRIALLVYSYILHSAVVPGEVGKLLIQHTAPLVKDKYMIYLCNIL